MKFFRLLGAELWHRRELYLSILAVVLFLSIQTAHVVDSMLNTIARHQAVGDIQFYVRTALRFLDPRATQSQDDIIWPPGTSEVIALFAIRDPTLYFASLAQIAMSILSPLFGAITVGLIAGRRAFFIALAISTLNSLFFQYGVYFLSECMFTFGVATTALVTALAARARGLALQSALAVVVGLAAAITFSFRGNILPVFFAAGAVALVSQLLRRRWGLLLPFAAAAITFSVAIVPITQRCTDLNRHHMCLGSVNGAMNVALGHAGTSGGLIFKEDKFGPETRWIPSSRTELHHYSGLDEVNASIYNTGGVMRWFLWHVVTHPGEFLVESIGNVFDLMVGYVWLGSAHRRLVEVQEQIFCFLVVAPATLIGLLGIRRLFLRNSPHLHANHFYVPLLIGMIVTTAITMGEGRYRVPFDFIYTGIMAAWLAGTWPKTVKEAASPYLVASAPPYIFGWILFALGAAGSVTLLSAMTIIGHPHPAKWHDYLVTPPEFYTPTQDKNGQSLLTANTPEGAGWDSPGTIKLDCARAFIRCDAAVVHFNRKNVHRVSVATDWNDAYGVEFLAGNEVLERTTIYPEGPLHTQGIRATEVGVSFLYSSKVDGIRVMPLFGDGLYSVGAIKVVR